MNAGNITFRLKLVTKTQYFKNCKKLKLVYPNLANITINEPLMNIQNALRVKQKRRNIKSGHVTGELFTVINL